MNGTMNNYGRMNTESHETGNNYYLPSSIYNLKRFSKLTSKLQDASKKFVCKTETSVIDGNESNIEFSEDPPSRDYHPK